MPAPLEGDLVLGQAGQEEEREQGRGRGKFHEKYSYIVHRSRLEVDGGEGIFGLEEWPED